MSEHKTNYWLFQGTQTIQNSTRSVGNIAKAAAKKAGIRKKTNPQIMRHSCATYFLKQDNDLSYLQPLLGNSWSKTTKIYTHKCNKHLAKVQSLWHGFYHGKTASVGHSGEGAGKV